MLWSYQMRPNFLSGYINRISGIGVTIILCRSTRTLSIVKDHCLVWCNQALCLWGKHRRRQRVKDVCFLQGGERARVGSQSLIFLRGMFPGHSISQFDYIPWPTHCQSWVRVFFYGGIESFFLWGYIKSKMYAILLQSANKWRATLLKGHIMEGTVKINGALLQQDG
jgi:hypothetical protein